MLYRKSPSVLHRVIVRAATAALLPALVLAGGTARAAYLPRVITASLVTVSCKGSFCMAAGNYSTQRYKGVSLTEAWTGTAWRDVPGLAKGDLVGVNCGGPAVCFGVRVRVPLGPAVGGAVWNGRRWTAVAGDFGGVSCGAPRLCMDLNNGSISEWNGKVWQFAPGANACDGIPQEEPCAYYNLSCGSASFCLADSYICSPYGCDQGEADLTWVWNGRSWNDPLGPGGVGGLSCSWGDFCMLPEYNTQALIWQSAGWQDASPNLPAVCHGASNCNLHGPLSCGAPQDCVVVPSNSLVSLVWADFAWKAVPLALIHGKLPQLTDLSCGSATNCMAIGTYGTPAQPVAEHWNGKKWQLTKPLNR